MKEETYEGVVLRNVVVQEGRHILTVFTLQEGVLSLATPQLSIHEMRLRTATTLLSRAEFCCRRGRGDIYRLLEASLLESFDSLRTQFSQLAAAGEFLHLILRSQLAGKPAPLLYELMLSYLRRLTITQHPLALVISFHLKLLKHEGLFGWTPIIPSIMQELASFSQEEWRCLGAWTDSRSFSEIESVTATPFLVEKVRTLLENLIHK
jgi:DNA repair protein RecO